MYQRARLGIGYLPQEASIFRGLTVEENIRAVLEVVEPDRKKRERRTRRAARRVQHRAPAQDARRSRCRAASGAASRSPARWRRRPNYMLLDEPFAGIDPIAVGDIQDLVRHLTDRGIGVLITDHNVRETLGLIDRAYIIYAGRGADRGHSGRDRQQSGCAPALSGRGIPALSVACAALRFALLVAFFHVRQAVYIGLSD